MQQERLYLESWYFYEHQMTIPSVLGSSDELPVAPHSPGSDHMECQYVRGIHVIFNLGYFQLTMALSGRDSM